MVTRLRLRPLEMIPVEVEGESLIALKDPLALSGRTMLVSPAVAVLTSLMDGHHGSEELAVEFRRITGMSLEREALAELVGQLEANYLLDNDTTRRFVAELEASYAAEPVRLPCRAGHSYPDDPIELRAMLDECLQLAAEQEPPGERLPRALLAPHIDYGRGAWCYGLTYSRLVRMRGPVTFVIIGTGHGGVKGVISATRKHFQTPLGRVETDQAFLDRLEAHSPIGLGKDVLCHRMEHSIEYQVNFLQYLLEDAGPWTIVPILVGSFRKYLDEGSSPLDDPDYMGFVHALKSTCQQHHQPVCLIGAVDLAHVGPQFGHAEPMDRPRLEDLARRDLATLERVAEVNAAGWYGEIAAEDDDRNVCGFPPIFTLLLTLTSGQGRLLGYDQSVDESGSVVSFCSLVFD